MITPLYPVEQCSRCLFDSSIAKIHADGICEYCRLQEKLALQSKPEDWPAELRKIKTAGDGKKYDCLIGISGGMDSSVLLYLAVKVWGLRPLAIHMDNRWNVAEADHNIKLITDLLNVDLITYRLNKREYDALNDAFLAAKVPDADIPNDIAMTKLMYEAAAKNGIKYILNGHDFRNEGSTPAKWTYMDAKYIQSVYKAWTGLDLKNYPLFTFWDQIFYGLIGIRNIRPFHYSSFNYDAVLDELKAKGWRGYGAKHCENIYTEFVGAWLLPVKFGIDKRRVYLSAQIREGMISRKEGLEIVSKPGKFDFNKLGAAYDRINELTAQSGSSRHRIENRDNFERYDFKKYRLVIWILAKLKVVPYTFYKKYCLR